MRVHVAAVVAVMGLLAACSSSDVPVAPRAALTPPELATSRAASTGGLTGFRFEPPMVPGPSPKGPGTFDATLLDLLAVEICEWSGTTCIGAPVRRITSTDGPPSRLVVNTGAEVYRAVWNSALDQLDPSKAYRLRVLGSGTEIGYANIDVVSPSDENATQSDQLRVVQGSTLPIVFRIEVGLGTRATPAGGTISVADGAVTLAVPAGAIPDDVLITARPATGLPASPPIAPGTAWEFGPDGITFAKPVTMTIAYDPSMLPAGMTEDKLRIHKLVNGTWVQQNAGLVDPVNNTVSAQVNGFSTYALLVQLAGGTQADVLAPDILGFSFFDAASGTFQPSLTIDVSSGDIPVRMRMQMTDNGAGVDYMRVSLRSPSGRQVRLQCYYFATTNPVLGSDTNGEWECTSAWPRYGEPGAYSLDYIQLQDKVRNLAFFRPQPQSPTNVCDIYRPVVCLTSTPQITVVSSPSDVTAPTVGALQVSANVQPRNFGPSVSVDVGTSAKQIIFGLQLTDDLSGGGAPQFQYVGVIFRSPGNVSYAVTCQLTQGTTLAGNWECPWTIPQNSGAWTVTALYASDRAGNGSGFAAGGAYTLRPNGQLCNGANVCLVPPTVTVTSTTDLEAPLLQSALLSVGSTSATGTPVTGTMEITDNLTGATSVWIGYRSTTTNQIQGCWATRTAGTPLTGTWSCAVTFSNLAARGQWDLYLFFYDAAQNTRSYYRRASDGYLCYNDNANQPVCGSFGTTSLTLQ